MTKVFIFHIDLTLTVAMVTENVRQYRLKYRKCLFRPHFGGFTDNLFKNYISAQLNTKKIFKYFMYLVIIYHPFKYICGICLCSMLTGLLNLQILVKNDIFFYFSLFWRPFSETIATIKVRSI